MACQLAQCGREGNARGHCRRAGVAPLLAPAAAGAQCVCGAYSGALGGGWRANGAARRCPGLARSEALFDVRQVVRVLNLLAVGGGDVERVCARKAGAWCHVSGAWRGPSEHG